MSGVTFRFAVVTGNIREYKSGMAPLYKWFEYDLNFKNFGF
jgi:hypothetical protein